MSRMPAITEQDRYYMRMALSLAMRGTGKVSPNPMVGCVVAGPEGVRGWGYHSALGAPHAEVMALEMAGTGSMDATLYVNLEPCCHFGRTPPCVPRIINAGIKTVVAGIPDPDPRVSCKGFQALRSAGVDVVEGVLYDECRKINRGFLSRIERKRPWVTLKAAVTMNGSMALESGESKWISNVSSRIRAHMLRDSNDAVMIGAGTVEKDDPQLNVRNVPGRDPAIVIIDPDLRTSDRSRVLRSGCYIFGLSSACPEKIRVLEEKGCRVFLIGKGSEGFFPLSAVLEILAGNGVNNLLVEGGPGLFGSFFRERLFDSISLFFSPRFTGEGKNICSGFRVSSFDHAQNIHIDSIRDVDGDLWLEGINNCSLV